MKGSARERCGCGIRAGHADDWPASMKGSARERCGPTPQIVHGYDGLNWPRRDALWWPHLGF